MAKEIGFYWAWDENERPQPVEVLGNGMVGVVGVSGTIEESFFVHIGPRIDLPEFAEIRE